MSQVLWTAVDDFLAEVLVGEDEALDRALAASDAAGLPPIQVAANQGKLLNLLALAIGARRILEIGTLGGYSAIWLARALPEGGRLVSLEVNPKHAEVARSNLASAGLAERVEVRVGPAVETLAQLVAEGAEPFDLVFIDADKQGYPAYLDWSLKLTHKGSLILADNVVRDGAVADPSSEDPLVQAVQAYLRRVAAEPRLSSTALQTVGVKGYDGIAISLVVEGA